MESTVHVDNLASGVNEQPVGDGSNRFGDVGAFAHAALWNQPGGDPILVAFLHRGDHVGFE
jgi:hypothetical protein